MVRFVHKERAYAAVIGASAVFSGAIGFLLTGSWEMPDGKAAALAIGVAALWALFFRAGPRRLTDVPRFEAAVPLADPVAAPASHGAPRGELRRFYAGMLAFWTVCGTALAYAEPLTAFLILLWAVDPLVRAAHAARWERRHGLLLWQGRPEQTEQPGETSGQATMFTSACPTTPGR